MIRFILSLSFCSLIWGAPLQVRVTAEAALLMNAETGAILFSKKGEAPMYPASLTKIGTTLYALKKGGEEKVTPGKGILKRIRPGKRREAVRRYPPYILETDGVMFGIRRGEEIPFRDLLHAVMLISACDASNVVAHHVGGSIPAFMEGLNAYLKEIGCKNTNFSNPSGLYYPDHKSTAHDLALLTRAALKSPELMEIVGQKVYEAAPTKFHEGRLIKRKNRLLIEGGEFYYPKATGLKTGYFSDAGYCLSATASDGKRTLIAILLNTPTTKDRYRDAIKLFEKAFAEEKVERLLFNREEKIFQKRELIAELERDVVLSYYPSEESDFEVDVVWETLALPIKKGERVGELKIIDALGNVVAKEALIATETHRKLYSLSPLMKLILLLAICVLGAGTFLIIKTSHKEKKVLK